VIEVGRVPGTAYFADLERHPENERTSDVLVMRSEGSLLYFNVDHVRDQLSALHRSQAAAPRLLIFFMGSVPFVDLAGAEFLADLHTTLREQGIEFRLAETHGIVREALRRLGPAHAAALAERDQTVDDVLSRWRSQIVGSSGSTKLT
jgi:MFS superfamily sulfate permease-like transporter